jgi:protein phosphatase PTC7
VDSGKFSKTLVYDIKSLFDSNNAQELRAILVEAARSNKEIGSSTCVLAKFDTENPNTLRTTNLGDSGYVLFRPQADGELGKLFRSKEQQYSFNFPYQCGTGAELPYQAEDKDHEVQDGDIIVMGSDGMFDNLFDHDVADCVKPNLKDGWLEGLQECADCLA